MHDFKKVFMDGHRLKSQRPEGNPFNIKKVTSTACLILFLYAAFNETVLELGHHFYSNNN